MAKPKTPRKELLKEPDKIITTTARVLEVIQRKRRLFTICGIGILVVALFVWTWRIYQDRKERQAQDLQAQAYQLYRKAIEQTDSTASKDLLTKATERFQEVIERFDGTRASHMARIYRGHASFALGRYADAIGDYESAVKGISVAGMKELALQGLGYSLMAKGDTDRAIEAFENLQDVGGGAYYGTVRWNIARCYERQGRVNDALEIYKELEQSAPDQIHRMLAEAKVSELTQK